MAAPTSLEAAGVAAPEPRREYPIKLGATMTGGGGGRGGKRYFALQVVHMPDVSDSAGALTRTDDALRLRVPTANGGGVALAGTRAKASSKMGEYIFELRGGVVYLERVSDSFAGMRPQPGEVAVEPPTPPTPRTPEPELRHRGGASAALPAAGGIAKKRTSPVKHHPVARKKVGAKTVPRNANGAAGGESSSDSSGDSDSSDSDGSSDNDSDDYTSESSEGD